MNPTPTLDDLRAYMRAQGWTERPPGIAGSLWRKAGTEIGVPHGNDADPELGRFVISRLAAHEGVTEQDVLDRVQPRHHFGPRVPGTRGTTPDPQPLRVRQVHAHPAHGRDVELTLDTDQGPITMSITNVAAHVLAGKLIAAASNREETTHG